MFDRIGVYEYVVIFWLFLRLLQINTQFELLFASLRQTLEGDSYEISIRRPQKFCVTSTRVPGKKKRYCH